MVYSGNNIIKTVIGGQDIFIDPIKDQYYFFNEAGEEFSGFLTNEQGEIVSDVKEFLAEKFDLVSIDDTEAILDQGASDVEGETISEEVTSAATKGVGSSDEIIDSAPTKEDLTTDKGADLKSKAVEAIKDVKESFRESSEKGDAWEKRNELFDKIDTAGEAQGAFSKEKLLSILSEKIRDNTLLDQDKYILEMIEQKGGQDVLDGSDMEKIIYGSSLTDSPSFKQYVDFFDLRQVAGQEKIEILNRMISENLNLTDQEHLEKLAYLQEKGVFSVVNDINDKPVSIKFDLGEASSSADFSVKGLKELSTLVANLIKG
jgi:hypothetical protein